MNRFIKSYWKYIVTFLLIMVTGYGLLYFTYQQVKKEMVDGLNARQLVHAKQAAKGIEIFFGDHINTLQIFSKNEHITAFDKAGKRLMREFLLSHVGEISIIARIDTRGMILYSEPYDRKVIGQPVSSMEAFLKVKRANQITVSDVFTNRRGFKSIIVHAPVIKNGHFDGTLALLLSFSFIANRYIEDIQIGKDGYAWMVSSNGTELSCPVPSHAGNSVFDNSRTFPDILAMAQRLIKGEQGVATYIDDRIRGNVTRKTIIHSVFMPVHLGDNFWSIVVSTPEDQVTGVLSEFRNRLLLIAILLLIGIGFFFYMLIKTSIVFRESELRRKSEEALREKSEELDHYFTSSLDLLCIANVSGQFIRLNPEWEKVLGYSLSELEGRLFLDFVHPDDMEGTLAAMSKLGAQEQVLSFENRYLCKDGSYRWIEWRSRPEGELIYAAARDITDRKRAEDESRLLASVILHSRELVNLVTPNGTMIFLNDAGKKMLGITEDEVAQTTIMQVIPEHLKGRVQQEVLPIIIRDGYWEGEMQYRNVKTGELTDVYATTYKIANPETGAVQFMANVSLDITERKRAEDVISAKNQELENYLYIASHDLRSPLVNIQGFSQRLQKQMDLIKVALEDCTLPPAAKADIDAITGDGIPKTLNFIFSSVIKMDTLLNGLLHISRTGRALMTINEIDINRLFQTIIANFNFHLTQLGATITAKDMPSCYGDENLLSSLFSNIIANAIKYHDKNRRLVIEVTAQKQLRKVIYSIRDNGLGIEPRHLEKIWDIFYRVDSTLADAGEGLGLSIVKIIAEKHKGRVWVESAIGKGSVFYVELQPIEFSE